MSGDLIPPAASPPAPCWVGWRRPAGGRWRRCVTAETEWECYGRLIDHARDSRGNWEMDVRKAGEFPVGKRED